MKDSRLFGKCMLLMMLLLTALLCGGCVKHATKSKSADGTTDISLSEEHYVLILPNESSTYDDLVAEGFSSIMEMGGKKYTICRPSGGTVLEQQKYVKSMMGEKVSCIAIAPNDAEALEEELTEVMENGIDVCSYERPAMPESRELMISPLGSEKVASTLMDAVLDLCGGMGQWVILSSSSVAVSQNAWIDRMKSVMKEEAYAKLELLEIAYGNDQFQTAYEQTRSLLQNYPDLEVICAPTTTGLAAAAAAVRDLGAQVKVTGFGLPSEMKEFVEKDGICPYFFLWNPTDLGSLTAYVSIALHGNLITGELGERFKAGELGDYEVTEADDGGTEAILSSPYRFDVNNINGWAKVF
ncbi:MAG: substrate-binding domain-containing protein [Lachnospiraceae bacterium]|nr:substrate-binding domain-containing protein [Lachnospiraceae bacterium]